jgi:RNA polymerase sigma-70 factor (ECF subfamily)
MLSRPTCHLRATNGSRAQAVTGTIEEIYRQHRNGLFTLALSITARPESAEDAVHDAIVRLCRTGKRPSGDQVAYVFAAVRNAAMDQKRRLRSLAAGAVSIFEVAEPIAGEDSESAMDQVERTRTVDAAIANLSDEQREAVVMHLYSGLTLAQSAAVLDVPLQTLASRYRRGLEKLREQLVSLSE